MTSPDNSPSSPAARTAGLSAEHRAALIAHLSERLAAVPSVPTRTNVDRDLARPRRSTSDDSAAATEPASSGRREHAASSRPPARTAIGASGTEGAAGRRRPEGGHPEDAPGDPETVAKQICLRQLTAAAKPRAALADVLQRRGIPDDVARSVLDRFTEVGLIDDEAYAAAYVSSKQRERSLGARALRMELRRKGLDDRVVTGAVADIEDDDERERAAALVARRIDAAMAAGPVAARRRLVGLLARRGYPSGLAHAVVSEALDRYDAPTEADDQDGSRDRDDQDRWGGRGDRGRVDGAGSRRRFGVGDAPDDGTEKVATDQGDESGHVDGPDAEHGDSEDLDDPGPARRVTRSRWPRRSLRSR